MSIETLQKQVRILTVAVVMLTALVMAMLLMAQTNISGLKVLKAERVEAKAIAVVDDAGLPLIFLSGQKPLVNGQLPDRTLLLTNNAKKQEISIVMTPYSESAGWAYFTTQPMGAAAAFHNGKLGGVVLQTNNSASSVYTFQASEKDSACGMHASSTKGSGVGCFLSDLSYDLGLVVTAEGAHQYILKGGELTYSVGQNAEQPKPAQADLSLGYRFSRIPFE